MEGYKYNVVGTQANEFYTYEQLNAKYKVTGKYGFGNFKMKNAPVLEGLHGPFDGGGDVVRYETEGFYKLMKGK